MSFLHILGDVGKTILKYGGPVAVAAVPGPLGTLISAGVSVAVAELDHGHADGSGPVKLAQATQSTLPAADTSPLPADSKTAHIQELINGIVQVLNALAALFPGAPAPAK